jgi:alkylhydroperoxidase family enzyme
MRLTKRCPQSCRLAMYVCVAVLAASTARLAGQARVDRPGGTRPVSLAKPRIPPLPESQWTDVHRNIAAKYATDGQVGNDLRTLLNVPQMADSLMPFYVYVSSESSLTPRHRGILMLRTAWLAGSEYMWSRHAALARKQGLAAEEIRRVAEGPNGRGWTPFDATLLSAADQLYRNCFINDATWKGLSAEYDMNHLMDAVMTIADITTLSLMYNSMGVQPDAGNAERIPNDIPYRVVVPEREAMTLKAARVEPVEGTGIAVGRTFRRYPTLAERRAGNSGYVNRSTLAPRYREMLILRTGWNCQSEYEWAQHVGNVGRARDHGLDPVRIAQGPDAPGWDAFEVAVLQAADELYRDALVSDRTWAALAARFDTTMMMNVLVSAANYRMVSMALNALGVQLEPGNEQFPKLPSR